ncbi:MAG: FAD-dependent oxidoreductase [Ramlibacter sp.]|nr:FAD-dependent oxidoreductase [Ramlibacter sp.]
MNARGLEQARHLFLGGCGLPGAWAGQPQWRILETGFGAGLNFLAAWLAWKQDSQRPRLLHYVAIDAAPVTAEDLLRSTPACPELVSLTRELATQWSALLPGVHRLVFEEGHVLLTLHVRDVRHALRKEPFTADSVFLAAQAWDLHTLKALARHCRRGTGIAGESLAGDMRGHLVQCGFSLRRAGGFFSPAWEPKARRTESAVTPGHCAVIGSGLAGASVAASLARRGWRVTVLDAADTPAAAASGLPAGLLAPNHSPDDNLLSRLSRCGVRLTLQQAKALLHEGDWQLSGAMEKRDGFDLWHEQAAWIKPATLVRAWLARPGIEWRGSTRVGRLERLEEGWQLWDAQGQRITSARLVVVAAAHASSALLDDGIALSPVRGQVSWALHDAALELPAFPLKGNGHFIPAVPLQGRPVWLTGSTYDRDDTGLESRAADHSANLARLAALAPEIARQLAPQFAAGAVHAWTGVRCATTDRRPLLAELARGLWVSTAMGSRGLTFAPLCAELLAARLHGEPLPLEHKLAQALDARKRRSAELVSIG